MMEKVQEIQLPVPVKQGRMPLEEAILKRRSQREFLQKQLDLKIISQLLWAAGGITKEQAGYQLRAAPSAGALYPMELYLVTRNGLFHYIPGGHKLEALSDKDLKASLARAALGQNFVREAPLNIVICAAYERVTGKYGKRGIMYAHMEAGHIAENIHLQAVALGLGSVAVGAFVDQELKSALALPPAETPLYIIPVGYIK